MSTLAGSTGDVGRYKFDIVVQGRFHAFALARALIVDGHDVVVYTNYPKSVAARFGVEPSYVRSFLIHGIGTRVAGRLGFRSNNRIAEPIIHRLFGAWAARNIRVDTDFVYGFTGVMEEYLQRPKTHPGQIRAIMRGSAHIREQSSILVEEEARAGTPIDRPSRWMINREEREYALADAIFTLSTFAHKTFVKWGVSESRLHINPLGVDVSGFASSAADVEAREKRILSGGRLRVLCVGRFSFQKGGLDFLRIADQLSGRMSFRFVGDVPPEARALSKRTAGKIEMINRVPEGELIKFYREADIFLFPTLHDGFAAVLAQAKAAGLPILATNNCSASDLVTVGESGWICPIRDPDAFIARLIWCDENRPALAQMASCAGRNPQLRSWLDMARELTDIYSTIRRARPEVEEVDEFVGS